MKTRAYLGSVLIVMLVILAAVPRLAHGSKPAGPLEPAGADATVAAKAPWFIRTVDSSGDVGLYASVTVEAASGRPYVGYYDASNGHLRMAKYVASAGDCGPDNDWSCETVDTYGDVGQYSSIAFDTTRTRAEIAYYDATGQALREAFQWAGTWTVRTIFDPDWGDSGLYASLKIDTAGVPQMAYQTLSSGYDSLDYAKYVPGYSGDCGGGAFQCDIIDHGDGVGQYASLAVDGSDQPRIAYYHGADNALMYAYQDGGVWTIREILPATSAESISLAVDPEHSDVPHIAYYDKTHGKLGYAKWVGSGGNCGFDNSSTTFLWQCDEIDDMGSTPHPRGVSLAVAEDGLPIIAYQSQDGSLMVARPRAALGLAYGNCGPSTPFYTWQCEVIDLPRVSVRHADYVSVDVHTSGLATIAYYGNIGSSSGVLKVAYQRLQAFLPMVVKEP